MYALIALDGGRQVKVEEGQELLIDYRGSQVDVGAELTFDRVLACGDQGDTRFGRPVIEGASVKAEVLGTKQGKKIDVIKFKRRKNYKRKQGHRQLYTQVKINKIDVPA